MKTKATINTESLSPLEVGRLNKCLNTKFNFSEGIYTLSNYILKYGKGKKISNVMKRTGNVRREYSLITDLQREVTIEIPKIVYDNLIFKTN